MSEVITQPNTFPTPQQKKWKKKKKRESKQTKKESHLLSLINMKKDCHQN